MAKGLSAAKAKKILTDGYVKGKPLTAKQKKYFGAIASGATPLKAIDGAGIEKAQGGKILKGLKNMYQGSKKFDSSIDWAKWNKAIPENKALMKEYNAIEEATKKNGTWMKNPDGSAFNGTPEQFVQENSENFKKAFPNGFGTTTRGDRVHYESMNKGVTFSGDKQVALNYTYDNAQPFTRNSLLGENPNPIGPGIHDSEGLYELYYPKKNNTLKIDGKGRNYSDIPVEDEGLIEYMKGKQVWTDDVANYIKSKDIDRAIIDNIYDDSLEPGQVIINNNKPGNYLKSIWGNDGMFDMNNPSIYRAIVPGAIGAGAVSQMGPKQEDGQFKNGGWLDKYQMGGSLPSASGMMYGRTSGSPLIEPGKLKKAQTGITEGLTREDFVNNLKTGMSNNLLYELPDQGGMGGMTNTYISDDGKIDTTTGLNCINGVCQMTESLTGKDFTGGIQGADGNYVGNQTFNSNLEKEGYYNVQVGDDNPYLDFGDVVQASKFKYRASRAKNKRPVGADRHTLIPQHAYVVGDIKYDENGKPVSYDLYHNSGEKEIIKRTLSQKDFEKRMKKGWKHQVGQHAKQYDGYIVNRYDPSVISDRNKLTQAETSREDQYESLYDNASNPVQPKDLEGINKEYPKLGKVFEYLNNNYVELGKLSDVPKPIFDQMVKYQIGLAGKETRFGDDEGFPIDLGGLNDLGRGVKGMVMDTSSPDAWYEDAWLKNANNVQSKYSSVEEYKEATKANLKAEKEKKLSTKWKNEEAVTAISNLSDAKSVGMYQQKEISKKGKEWGLKKSDIKGNPTNQFKASLALMIDNYERLKKQYPDKSDDELVYLSAASHNAPGKVSIPDYANFYGPNRDINYVNTANRIGEAILNTGDIKRRTKKAEDIETFVTDEDKLDSIVDNKYLVNEFDKDNFEIPDERLQSLKSAESTQTRGWLDKYEDGGEVEKAQWGKMLKWGKDAYKSSSSFLENLHRYNPFAESLNDINSSYRVAGMDAAEDFIESGMLRSRKTGADKLWDPNVKLSLSERVDLRTTGFPSFQKGFADSKYLPADGKGVIFKTDLPTFKRGERNPVTNNIIKGRHYAHRVIDPQTGKVVPSISASDVDMYEGLPHWLKGYRKIELPKSNFKKGGSVPKAQNGNFGGVNTDIRDTSGEPIYDIVNPDDPNYDAKYKETYNAGAFASMPNQLDEVVLNSGVDYEKYPLYDDLSEQDRQYFKDDGAIGRGVRRRAQTKKGLAEDTYDVVNPLMYGMLGVAGGMMAGPSIANLSRAAAPYVVSTARTIGNSPVGVGIRKALNYKPMGGPASLGNMMDVGFADMALRDTPEMYDAFKENPNWDTGTDLALTASDLIPYGEIATGFKGTRRLINSAANKFNDLTSLKPNFTPIERVVENEAGRLKNLFNQPNIYPTSSPLPKRMEPYLSQREIPISKEEELLQSTFDWNDPEKLKHYNDELESRLIRYNQKGEVIPKQKQGGVIEDDRGQWAHPGEVTKINSNNITMKGVNYPVLGISDTGDTQMMYPNGEYQYDGSSVTEYPMAKNGSSLVELNQLTNFTNYNTPQPGGWLDKYN